MMTTTTTKTLAANSFCESCLHRVLRCYEIATTAHSTDYPTVGTFRFRFDSPCHSTYTVDDNSIETRDVETIKLY